MRSQLFLVLSTTFAATIPTWNSHLPQERDVVPGQTCDQYGHFETSTYILYNNLWGKSLGRGDQCTTLHSNFSMESSSGPESISWTTNWNWSEAASQVKSYANVVLKQLGSKQVSQYNSIPAYWNFNYTGEGLVADVAFDIFTTSGLGDGDDYEIMLWLGKYGDAAPISSSAHPIATNVNLVGKVFDLYKGPNQSMVKKNVFLLFCVPKSNN